MNGTRLWPLLAEKREPPKELPFFLRTRSGSGDPRSARGSLHFAGVQAIARRTFTALNALTDDHADDLQVRFPRATRLVVRVRNIIAEGDSAIARSSIGCG
jgi:hypothetical protein